MTRTLAIAVGGPYDGSMQRMPPSCGQVCIRRPGAGSHYYVRRARAYRETGIGRAAVFDYVGATPITGRPVQHIVVPAAVERPDARYVASIVSIPACRRLSPI